MVLRPIEKRLVINVTLDREGSYSVMTTHLLESVILSSTEITEAGVYSADGEIVEEVMSQLVRWQRWPWEQ